MADCNAHHPLNTAPGEQMKGRYTSFSAIYLCQARHCFNKYDAIAILEASSSASIIF
jgi:hypothetical protein